MPDPATSRQTAEEAREAVLRHFNRTAGVTQTDGDGHVRYHPGDIPADALEALDAYASTLTAERDALAARVAAADEFIGLIEEIADTQTDPDVIRIDRDWYMKAKSDALTGTQDGG